MNFLVIFIKLKFLDKDLAHNSHECKILLKELTKFDPVKRISAADALKNKWFNLYKIDSNIDKGFIFDSFKYFMQYSPDQKFQQAALAYMVHHLTDMNDVSEIRKMFELFDTNNDGKLSHGELLEGFKKHLSIIQNEKEFLKVIKKIDQDRSGFIEFEGKIYIRELILEFVRATINKELLLTDEKLQITFKLFDKDGSGSITPQELKAILGLSSKYSDKVWNEIINQIEHNKENEVTYEEFKNMMLKMTIKN